MASVIETVILGIIQGLTEWLPVSSSGHLAVAKEFLGWQPPIIFFVLLHVATLFVVVAFFRKDIMSVLKAIVRRDFKSEEGMLAIFIILGTVPTAVIGYAFQNILKSFFDNLFVVGGALLATGVLLFVSERRGSNSPLRLLDAILVGVAQGVAIIPGVSRSGATISTGLARGMKRETAFRFSFLLSIPAVLGATVAELGDLGSLASSVDIFAVVAGMVVSMVVGYLSLKVLQKMVVQQRFHWFAFYCWAAGSFVIISQML